MGQFSIKLEFSGSTPPLDSRKYDPVLDDPGSILSDVCEALAESGQARFMIEGFGPAAWPVDVRTDLCVALEQMPVLVRDLRAGKEGTLDLYEQGVERTLTFRPTGETIEIECSSSTRWQPQSSSLRTRKEVVLAQLRAVLDEFCNLVKRMNPTVYDHPWFRQWSAAEWSASPLR